MAYISLNAQLRNPLTITMCRVKSYGELILKIRGQGRSDSQVHLALHCRSVPYPWILSLNHHNAQGEDYDEPKHV